MKVREILAKCVGFCLVGFGAATIFLEVLGDMYSLGLIVFGLYLMFPRRTTNFFKNVGSRLAKLLRGNSE